MDILVDLDGTLCDGTHRQHFIKTKPKNWPAYQAGCPHDLPIQPVIDLVNELVEAGRWSPILCSGRSEDVRPQTLEWLKKHTPAFDRFPLYMRSSGDFRRDDTIKLELLKKMNEDGYYPAVAIDDRPRVLRAWRSVGIFTLNIQQGEEDF